MRQQCAEGYYGNLCASCTRAQDGIRYGFYTAFTCTRCKSNATLVRGCSRAASLTFWPLIIVSYCIPGTCRLDPRDADECSV